MAKDKVTSKEYLIIVSLMIFFVLVTLVGVVRLALVLNNKVNTVDIDSLYALAEQQEYEVDYKNINMQIIDKISMDYGLNIYYGENTNLGSVNAVNIVDEYLVFEMLKEINEALSKYPKGLISEIESKGYTVSLYLVDHFNLNMEALANRNTIGQFNIYMSNTDDITRALHHEFYHILDYYIKLETNETYDMWNTYNPRGYIYPEDVNELTSKYVYKGESGAHFVTLYAKVSEKEDRAETFAEMLTASRDEKFFGTGEYIYSKINLIIDVLDSTFKTVRNEEVVAWK